MAIQEVFISYNTTDKVVGLKLNSKQYYLDYNEQHYFFVNVNNETDTLLLDQNIDQIMMNALLNVLFEEMQTFDNMLDCISWTNGTPITTNVIHSIKSDHHYLIVDENNEIAAIINKDMFYTNNFTMTYIRSLNAILKAYKPPYRIFIITQLEDITDLDSVL